MSKFTTGDAGSLTGSEKSLPVPPLPELEKTPEDIERAYRILLINVDDVIKKVRSNDIDPLNLPEAVAIATERMDDPDKQVLNELQTEREANGILVSIGVATLGGATLGATVVGAGGAAFILGAADTAIGGAFFAQEAEEYFDRNALEQASASHDRSLLGVPPTSGTEAIMLIVNGLLTAAALVNLTGALRGFVKSPKGTGAAGSSTPAISEAKPGSSKISTGNSPKAEAYEPPDFDRGVKLHPWAKEASDQLPPKHTPNLRPDTEAVAMKQPPPLGKLEPPPETPGAEVLASRQRTGYVEPPRAQPEAPGAGSQPSQSGPGTEPVYLAPKKPTPSSSVPRQPTDAELGVKVTDAEAKIRNKQPVVANRKAKAVAAGTSPDAKFSKGMFNAMEELSTTGQALVSRAKGQVVLEQVTLLGVESPKGAFTPTKKVLQSADASVLRKKRIVDVAESEFDIAAGKGLEAKSVSLGDYKSSEKLKWLWNSTKSEDGAAASSWMDMVLEQQNREIAIIDAARKQGGVVMFSGKVVGTNEKVVFFAHPKNIKVSTPMPYGGVLKN